MHPSRSLEGSRWVQLLSPGTTTVDHDAIVKAFETLQAYSLVSWRGDQGKHEEAETMHRQELELARKVLGREHPETLTSMDNLALMLSDQGKHEKAEMMTG
jgi:hypothetical protein